MKSVNQTTLKSDKQKRTEYRVIVYKKTQRTESVGLLPATSSSGPFLHIFPEMLLRIAAFSKLVWNRIHLQVRKIAALQCSHDNLRVLDVHQTDISNFINRAHLNLMPQSCAMEIFKYSLLNSGSAHQAVKAECFDIEVERLHDTLKHVVIDGLDSNRCPGNFDVVFFNVLPESSLGEEFVV